MSGVRKLIDIRLDGVDYEDNFIQEIPEWSGLKKGYQLPSGTIVGIFKWEQKHAVWAVVATEEATYEVDLPWN